MVSMPSSEMTTVTPAKTTDRPAVAMAVAAACRGSAPVPSSLR